MERAHSEILRKKLVHIGRNLYIDDDFLNYMEAEGILTEIMREEIEVEKMKSRKSSIFITLLKKRGPRAFKTFIDALMETQQSDLAKELHHGLAQEWEINNGELSTIPHGHTVSQSHQVSDENSLTKPNYPRQDLEDEEDDDGIDMKNAVLINVEVKPVDHTNQALTRHFFNPSSAVYKMNSNKRGRALIINNKTFPSYPQPERTGTDIDATNMDVLLSSLNYEVITKNDLNREEMLNVLSKESQQEDHAKFDSFICVILSHGGVNSIFGVDGLEVSLDDITSYFDNTNCPALSGKPKLFIIQACQGSQYDHGVMKEGTDTAPDKVDATGDSNVNEATQAMKKLKLDEPKEEIFKGQKLPTKGDMLIAFPSYVGYRSWRNAEFGSWYIRAVVEVFMKYSYRMHVEQLLKKVRRKIAKTQTINQNHYKQMTADYVSFQKDMYFFPGLELTHGETYQKSVHPCNN